MIGSLRFLRAFPLVLLACLALSPQAGRAADPAPGPSVPWKAGQTFQECAGCPVMVVVPPGRFAMGRDDGDPSEAPRHEVEIARAFAVAIHPVLGREWKACVKAGACDAEMADDWGDDTPLTGTPWKDAQAYVAWLSKTTGHRYRLLTEAEFEYVAWDPARPVYPWGGRSPAASCIDCGSAWDGKSPSPAGSFAANRFGIFDAVSNVGIMVEDCYHETFVGAPRDGSAWLDPPCLGRVVRGGSWADLAENLNAKRRYYVDGARYPEIGFRVVRSLE